MRHFLYGVDAISSLSLNESELVRESWLVKKNLRSCRRCDRCFQIIFLNAFYQLNLSDREILGFLCQLNSLLHFLIAHFMYATYKLIFESKLLKNTSFTQILWPFMPTIPLKKNIYYSFDYFIIKKYTFQWIN